MTGRRACRGTDLAAITLMPPEPENQFLDEVLGLFGLEAQEWVTQANVALAELTDPGKPCPPERATKLYETIVRGVSNLGGSAATVNLSGVEKIAFALLPVLQVMQAHQGRPHAHHTEAVRQALDAILTSVRHISEKKSGEVEHLDEILEVLEGAKSASGEAATSSAAGGRAAALRTALAQLHEVQSRAPEGSRNIAETVLHKAEGDSEQEIDDRTVARILRELESLDQQFLDEVRKRAPAINEGFSRFKADHGEANGTAPRLDEHGRARIFQDIEHLYEIARLVNSSPIMMYLGGLKSFLSVAVERPILISEQRYQAVGSRLALLQTLAERWVEIGRSERASIERMLQP